MAANWFSDEKLKLRGTLIKSSKGRLKIVDVLFSMKKSLFGEGFKYWIIPKSKGVGAP